MRIILTFCFFFLMACGAEYSTKSSVTNGTSSSALSCNCPNTNTASVCGSDGRTYSSACFAQCAGVEFTSGSCGLASCNQNSGPVCGQPPFNCPQGMVCAQVMPAPVTYSNDCARVQAGAEFIQNGNCPSNIIVSP